MKTVIVPVIDWRAVEQMDSAYIQRWWAEVLWACESWSGAIRWFLERSDRESLRRGWRPYFLAVACTYRAEIEAQQAALVLERSVAPLPGLEAMAARSAATP